MLILQAAKPLNLLTVLPLSTTVHPTLWNGSLLLLWLTCAYWAKQSSSKHLLAQLLFSKGQGEANRLSSRP